MYILWCECEKSVIRYISVVVWASVVFLVNVWKLVLIMNRNVMCANCENENVMCASVKMKKKEKKKKPM